MKAIILVGGYGTRLRPLTLSVPKPLIEFCNKPIVEYQIQAAAEVGVKKIILAVAHQSDVLLKVVNHLQDKYNVRIVTSLEKEPLGTAGPLALAKNYLCEDDEGEIHPELFFTFNSDIICTFPLESMLQAHKQSQAEGTICCTKVKNPSNYGVIIHDSETRRVLRFVEKPEEWVGDDINAGIYLFNRKMLSRINLRPTSIEREIFPAMAYDQQLCIYPLTGYWADIGIPRTFLEGMKLHLRHVRQEHEKMHKLDGERLPSHSATSIDGALLSTEAMSSEFYPGEREISSVSGSEEGKKAEFLGNVLVDPSATIGTGCLIGPDVTIGANCIIGNGVRIKNSAIMPNVRVKECSWIDNSIVGWECTIGKWARLEGLTVLGADVNIKPECFINGAFVLPHKSISESLPSPGAIIM